MPEPTTERIAALLAAELYEAVMEASADEWTRWEFLTEFRREPFLKEGRRIFGRLVEAGVGFVAEAERERDEWREAAHDGAFQQARAERAEELFRDANVRLDEQRKMTDEAEERIDRLRDELGYAIRTRDEWESNAERAEAALAAEKAQHDALRVGVVAELASEDASAVLYGVTGTHPAAYGGVTKDEALECAGELLTRLSALLSEADQ